MSDILKKLTKEMQKVQDPKRFTHTLGVEYTAAALAMRYGEDVERAQIAGLLHDCAKCMENDKLLSACEKYHLPATDVEKRNPYLLHARVGSYLAKKEYKIEDPEILSAILYHTTGRPGMTLLEQIIFTADYIEPGRKQAPNLTQIRHLAFTDLDAAVTKILEDTLEYLKSGDGEMDPMTEETYNYYKKNESIIYEKFAKEAENQPFEIVAAEAFTADNKTDFSVQLQKAKDAGADMVFLPIYYQESALILTQAAAMGYAPKWFSCDGMDGILGGVDNFDVSLTEGVMLLTPFAADATDDLTQSFVTKYKEKYGDTPNQFAADSYDAIYVIKAAIEKSGVTPDMSVSDICDGMKAAMTEITVDGLTGSGMTWTADGEANKAPKAVVIENGAYKAM